MAATGRHTDTVRFYCRNKTVRNSGLGSLRCVSKDSGEPWRAWDSCGCNSGKRSPFRVTVRPQLVSMLTKEGQFSRTASSPEAEKSGLSKPLLYQGRRLTAERNSWGNPLGLLLQSLSHLKQPELLDSDGS